MGDRSTSARSPTTNIRGTRRYDKYSARSESVHAGLARRLLGYSDGIGFMPGARDDTETDAHSEDSAGECKHGYGPDGDADTRKDSGPESAYTNPRHDKAAGKQASGRCGGDELALRSRLPAKYAKRREKKKVRSFARDSANDPLMRSYLRSFGLSRVSSFFGVVSRISRAIFGRNCYRGTSTVLSMSEMTASVVEPSSSASARRARR